ncbi:15515_t:CDS:1, partial [Dentiscutata erythropus]
EAIEEVNTDYIEYANTSENTNIAGVIEKVDTDHTEYTNTSEVEDTRFYEKVTSSNLFSNK